MSKKIFDEMKELTLPKFAKKLVEMTYLYKNTEVPEKHYKDLLSQEITDLMSNDVSFQVHLLQCFYNGINNFVKENPKQSFIALFCIDNNIKVSDIDSRTYYALNELYNFYDTNRKVFKNVFDVRLVNQYKELYQNGFPQTDDVDDIDDDFLKN